MQFPRTLSWHPPHDPMSADNVTGAGRRLRDLCSLPLAESPSSSPGLETLLVRDSWLYLVQARGPPTRPALPPFLFPLLPLRGEPSHLPVPTWLPAPASPSCPVPPACSCRSELQEQPFSFCLSPAQKLSGRPCAKESKAEPLSSVFRLCSSWGIWENRYRGVPGSLPNAPLLAKVPGRRPNPSGGWGEGWPMETTAGFQLWAPSVLPELTSQTCRSSLGVLQRRGLILSTWGAP